MAFFIMLTVSRVVIVLFMIMDSMLMQALILMPLQNLSPRIML